MSVAFLRSMASVGTSTNPGMSDQDDDQAHALVRQAGVGVARVDSGRFA